MACWERPPQPRLTALVICGQAARLVGILIIWGYRVRAITCWRCHGDS
jgi:hypothetical protein